MRPFLSQFGSGAGEFLAVARQIAGITKHKEARQALEDSIVARISAPSTPPLRMRF
jgi:hypothetical protein